MFKNIPENIRLMINSTIPLVVVIVLFVIAGQFGFTKISVVRNEISKSQKDQTILSQKLDLLGTLSATAADSVIPSSVALPGSNPSIAVASQVKTLASQNGVVVANIKGGTEVKDNSGLSRADISFDVLGPRSQIIALIQAIGRAAPLTLVDKIKISEAAGAARATVSVKTFWAAFPDKLPALTEAMTDLTADEKKTLSIVANLTQPQFIEVPPGEGVSRPDPFTQ